LRPLSGIDALRSPIGALSTLLRRSGAASSPLRPLARRSGAGCSRREVA
jgi:hypothetical protein